MQQPIKKEDSPKHVQTLMQMDCQQQAQIYTFHIAKTEPQFSGWLKAISQVVVTALTGNNHNKIQILGALVHQLHYQQGSKNISFTVCHSDKL